MSATVSVAEFARLVGISRPRIYQLVDQGRIPTVPGGPRGGKRIPLAEGKAAWDADRGIVEEQGPSVAPSASASAPKANGSARQAPTVGGFDAADIAIKLAAARAADKSYQAEARKLKLEELRGSLLPAVGVRAEAEHCATRVRAALLSVPSRLASRLEGRTAAEIEVMLGDGIVEALTGLISEEHG